jgi:hypothetical protein
MYLHNNVINSDVQKRRYALLLHAGYGERWASGEKLSMILKKYFAFCVLFSLAATVTAQDCYESSIVSPNPFMGNNGEIFKLDDGSLWEVKYEYEYLYEYYPSVIICPSKGKLSIKEKTLNVEEVGGARAAPPSGKTRPAPSADIIESQIDGEFSGWEGETIFKLTSGQIWQQSSYAYTYSYKYRPKVLIFPTGGEFELQVEGMDRRIKVVRIR